MHQQSTLNQSSSSSNLISDSEQQEHAVQYRRLPLRLQFAYGVGHVLNDVCASMWFTYLLVFFHLVLEFSNWEAGLVLLVGQVADALATPFVGFHSDQIDNFWLCKYGRRKTWHLVGTIAVLLAFPFIFSPCINCQGSHKWAQLFYYCVFVVIFQFGWAAVQISHLSLIPELTPDEHDRTKLTAIRYGFTVLSNVSVYVITWFVLHLDGADDAQIGPTDAPKFQNIVWIGLGIGVIASFIFHIFVRETDHISNNDTRNGGPRNTVLELLCNSQMYQVAVVYMSTRLFVNLSQVFIPLYLHETLNMAASSLALVPLVMFLGSFVASLFIEMLNRGLGRRMSYVVGTTLGIAACLWIQFRDSGSFISVEIYIVAVLFGISGSIILVTSLGITADLIGDKTGSGAFVYGIMSFTDKMANGIAVVIIQDLHSGMSRTTYYRDALSYVCGGAALMGALATVSLVRWRRERDGYTEIITDNSINPATLEEDTLPQI